MREEKQIIWVSHYSSETSYTKNTERLRVKKYGGTPMQYIEPPGKLPYKSDGGVVVNFEKELLRGARILFRERGSLQFLPLRGNYSKTIY